MPFDHLVAHQVGDPLDQVLLVDLIRDLGDDQRDLVALLVGLDLRLGAHLNGAAAGGIRLDDAVAAEDEAAGREVRARDQLDQLLQLRPTGENLCVLALLCVRGWLQVGLFNQPDAAVDHLLQIVRRDIGRHADRDSRRAVDEQVRKRRRQDRRLFGGLVVVGGEVDGLLVEVRHQVVGERLQPRLGVAHRRRRIAVDRAEVPLAVDQGISHVELLRHSHERVVDRRVAVRVEIAHHLADDLGALAVAARRGQPHRLHPVEDAAVRRLEAVARVGQRSSDDYAHGVIHVRALHLVFDVDGVLRGGEISHKFGDWGLGTGGWAEPIGGHGA